MIPIISKQRLEKPGGLWTTKSVGSFVDGNPTTTSFFVEGKVEIKELGGHLKAFFKGVKLSPRLPNASEATKKEKEDDDSDASSDKAEEVKTSEQKVVEDIQIHSILEHMPKLQVFMTTKKPKKRMVDAHTSGTKLKIPQLQDGTFASFHGATDYEAPLVDIADILSFQGIVVLKLPSDEPVTDEPIIFGYVRLQSFRSMRVRAIDALHLSELADMHAKLVLRVEMAGKVEVLGPAAKKFLKPLHVYRNMAAQAWSAFSKGSEDTIDFAELLKMLDHLNLFFLSYQAQRIFDAVDTSHGSKLDISELENFLIAKDLLSPFTKDLSLLDAFDAFKTRPLDAENAVSKLPSRQKFLREQVGMDYSAFIEAIQLLGSLTKDPEEIRDAFCYGGDIKAKDAEQKYLTNAEFRRGWLKIADVNHELEVRGIVPESGMFAENRNRERLNRFIGDREAMYVQSLATVNTYILQLKADHRKHKDETRREREAHRERLLHEANKFIAQRSQEKRLQLKKEQEEKAKKRLEDKVLRNKLLLRQQEAILQKRAEIAQANLERERLKVAEIRALGLDKLDHSVQELRVIPIDLYKGKEAQLKLTYVLFADLSHNMIEEIPPDAFFYWMSDIRKMKLSQNRLRTVPDDTGFMAKLEILELDSNRLESLPESIGELLFLQRLNVSNNHLTKLPETLGRCAALKYISAHSNHLNLLPSSLGGCFQLEYIDASRNQLHELPEDMQYLVSLTHLDLSSNRVGHLPFNFGGCQSLLYLDLSENVLASVPQSFSQLKMLEYCNLENNSIISLTHCLGDLQQLKYLNCKRNHIRQLGSDLGAMVNLTSLDLSLNELVHVPLEIGLLISLQELKLQRNKLANIPPELGSCTALQTLDISYNAITGPLPETLALTRTLRHMDISFNKIDFLPESFVGFIEIVQFKAERCLLQAFPQSTIFLDHLQEIDVPNNHFTRFPIELHSMKSLKKLNLYNNSIALLPRDINLMQFLDELNLGRNQLQAVPVDFVEILESVPSVNLIDNPWGLLPEKWGRRRHGKESSDAPLGYSLTDALDFLYAMRSFYHAAEAVWDEFGVFYYTGRLGFNDFLQMLREKIPSTWHEGLVDYAKHVFFTSKQSGLFVRWYSLTDEEQMTVQQKANQAVVLKEQNIAKSHQDEERRQKITTALYDQNLQRRMRQAYDQIAEHHRGEEYIESLQSAAVHEGLRQAEKKVLSRQIKREKIIEEQRKLELNRMFEILKEDAPVRELEKQTVLEMAKQRNREQKQQRTKATAAT